MMEFKMRITKIFESDNTSNMLEDKSAIIRWLTSNNIQEFKIHDGTNIVDVYKGVSLNKTYNHDIGKHLPVKFGDVNGGFNLDMIGVESLIGCPNKCKFINCSRTNISNFNGIGTTSSVIATRCQDLTSLDGLPNKLDTLDISYCDSLNDINGLPEKIGTLIISKSFCQHIKGMRKRTGTIKKVILAGDISEYQDIVGLLNINGLTNIEIHNGFKISSILNDEIIRQPVSKKRNLLKVAYDLSNAGYHHLTVM